jgi:hypothetical protein
MAMKFSSNSGNVKTWIYPIHLLISIFVILVFNFRASAQGKIVVANDEWGLSNTGFTNTSDAHRYALNLAGFLAPKGKRILCYSDNFSFTGSMLDSTLTNAGYFWRISTTMPFVVDTLLSFDAVWLAGFPDHPDTTALIEYVRRGGGVYLCGGTHLDGLWTANAWNGFLTRFGLSFLGSLNGVAGNISINEDHPVFAGINNLYQLNGNSIVNLIPSDSRNKTFIPNGGGWLFAIHDEPPTNIGLETLEMIPQEFALQQNFPNPFNPTTTIRYGLPHQSHVTMTVHNTLGQQVVTLVGGEVDPGYHEVRFDGAGLTSGVYFYRIQADGFVQTKKLLVIH